MTAHLTGHTWTPAGGEEEEGGEGGGREGEVGEALLVSLCTNVCIAALPLAPPLPSRSCCIAGLESAVVRYFSPTVVV